MGKIGTCQSNGNVPFVPFHHCAGTLAYARDRHIRHRKNTELRRRSFQICLD
jgi:hypothetical protein